MFSYKSPASGSLILGIIAIADNKRYRSQIS